MKPTKNLSWLFSWLTGVPQGKPYELLEVVSPVVEIGMDWPMDLQVYNGDFTAVAGTNTVTLPSSQVEPSNWFSGRHRLWYNLSASYSAAPGTSHAVLCYEQNQLSTRRCNLVDLVPSTWNAGSVLSLIGSATAVNGTPFRGISQAYVKDPDRLLAFFTNMVGGETIYLRGLFLELPSAHPFPKVPYFLT